MRPIDRFMGKPKSFWAAVRLLSQKVGYSQGGGIIIPSMEDMIKAFADMDIEISELQVQEGPIELAVSLLDYFAERGGSQDWDRECPRQSKQVTCLQ